MTHYRCKCGNSSTQTDGSSHPVCDRCPDCGSGLSETEKNKPDAKKHYLIPSGRVYACWYCHRTQKQLEHNGVASEWIDFGETAPNGVTH